MTAFRDDHDAALARADALERELARERAGDVHREARVQRLEAEVSAARQRLEAAEAELEQLRARSPKPAVAPAPTKAPATWPRSVGKPDGLAPVLTFAVVIVGIALIAFGGLVCKGPPEHKMAALATPRVARVDDLISAGIARMAMRSAAARLTVIEAKYVDDTGALHPRFGELSLGFQAPPPPPPPDDPSRPTGAPGPAYSSFGECWSLHDTGAGDRDELSPIMSICLGNDSRPLEPRCTMAAIISRARAAGAPAGSLAHVKLKHVTVIDQDTLHPVERPQWSFSIHDETRGVAFSVTFADDCGAE